MQCTNCRFQNMPGSEVCGRCGTSLALATAVLDVHPPRAGRFAKTLRRAVPVRRIYNVARQNDVVARASAGVEEVVAQAPTLPVLIRLPVPGWAHLYLGQSVRGRLFLWSFVGLLLLGLIFLGSTWGSIFLGLAFSVHSSAIMDLDTQADPTRSVQARIGRSIVFSLALFFVLYMPAGRLLALVADPHSINRNMPPFLSGDVVLMRPSLEPRVGRVVLYDLPSFRYTVETAGHGRYLEYTGERIDRIIAGPGDDVRWEDGRLWVNGSISPYLPLSPQNMPAALTMNIQPGNFLIFPTTSPEVPHVNDTTSWKRLSLIPSSSIRGHVYARTQPLYRFTIFH